MTQLRYDLQLIQQWIDPDSRVLDLACGDGSLLAALRQAKNVSGYGMEISQQDIVSCLGKGINVIHRDIELGLTVFAERAFDYVLTTHSIQTLKFPAKTLVEMVRVGKRGIVSFPNMAHWRCRMHIALKGRMPVTSSLPDQWFDTPNYHLCTLYDFEQLCADLDITIVRRAAINSRRRASVPNKLLPNLFSETALYEISRR